MQCPFGIKPEVLESGGNPMTVVEEHSILAEAVPKGAVDGMEERMPV